MGFFGNLIGSTLGKIGSKVLPIPGVDGGQLGGFLGNLAPFKQGGRVRPMGAFEKGGRVLKAPLAGTPHFRKGGKVRRKRKAKK